MPGGDLGIIVQARMSSSRFPGKSLKEIGGKPLIHYVVSRLNLTGLPVIVCTSNRTSDDPLADYLKNSDINYFRGDLEDVLDRYIRTAEEFGIKRIVRVTGDNPLVDTDLLLHSLPLFHTYNYVDGIYPGGFIKGIGFELVTLKELQNIPSGSKIYREHVTNWLRENLSASDMRTELVPDAERKFQKDIFLSCDYSEDLELLQNIFEYYNFRLDIRTNEILELLEEFPTLKEINKHLHN